MDGHVCVRRVCFADTVLYAIGWKAVSKFKDANNGQRAGLVVGWNQAHGRMYAAGDVQYIQIWVCG